MWVPLWLGTAEAGYGTAKQEFGACFARSMQSSLLLDADFQNLTGMQGGGRLIKTDERGESEG